MTFKKKKFYVVWRGWTPGVYKSWFECEAAIKGFSNAKYKSFATLQEAKKAFAGDPEEHIGKKNLFVSSLSEQELAAIGQPIRHSLCVDAAWNAQTKFMEYRGVWNHNGHVAFSRGPFPNATNNIGELLAIVHGLAQMAEEHCDWPIYSDSQTAIAWVRDRKVNSKSIEKGETSERVNALVERALNWLRTHDYPNPILKWETVAWGEIPADFGRK